MRLGLAGYPITHSLSPVIHNAAYQELGLDWDYGLYPCETEKDFIALLTAMRSGESEISALNVTTPYKGCALSLCDERDLEAEVIGAANALACSGPSTLCGHNTDGRAITYSLQAAGVDLKAAQVVICGTGPVAASALYALVQHGVIGISILSRDEEKAKRFISQFEVMYRRMLSLQMTEDDAVVSVRSDLTDSMRALEDYQSPVQFHALSDQTLPVALEQATVLIDATPLGMQAGDPAAVPGVLLHSRLTVLDTVYGHGETAIMAAARAAGAQALDGLGMLIEQAALSIEHWSEDLGISQVIAPRETMLQAAQAELKRRGV